MVKSLLAKSKAAKKSKKNKTLNKFFWKLSTNLAQTKVVTREGNKYFLQC
jgi:hypothetical protein